MTERFVLWYGRCLGGGQVGHSLLLSERISASLDRGEGAAAEYLLERYPAPARKLGGIGARNILARRMTPVTIQTTCQ